MSAREQIRGKRKVASNLYTAILAMAFGVILATAVYVSLECYFQYGTIFKIP